MGELEFRLSKILIYEKKSKGGKYLDMTNIFLRGKMKKNEYLDKEDIFL